MSIITSVGIVILIMLIQVFLQLVPSIFALFYHYALAKNSQKHVKELSTYFIFGAVTVYALLLITLIFLMPNWEILEWILVGIFCSLSLASFLFYYRKGDGTRLFVPRKVAKTLSLCAKKPKNRSDIFMLGMMSVLPEIFFSLPLLFLLAIEISGIINPITRASIAILDIVVIAIPLVITRIQFRAGRNLADIQRVREKNKKFYRSIIAVSYLLLALLIISYRILG